MATSRTDPYLCLHLSGLATVPLWLDGCLAGLAVGDPIAPSTVEIALLAIVGIVPVLAMQWQRPFYLFSLLVIAVQPAALTPAQRQLLRVQRHWFNRVISLAIAAALGWLLVVLYHLAPIASDITPFTRWGHAGGWLVAAGCFWGANLFLQVAVSALRLLIARPRAINALEPYPTETVTQDFTVVGLRLKRILPPSWVPDTALPAAPETASAESSPPSSVSPAQPELAILESAIAEESGADADSLRHHPLPAVAADISEAVPVNPDGEPLAPEILAAETDPVSDPLPLEAESSEPEPAQPPGITQPPTTPPAGETLDHSDVETYRDRAIPSPVASVDEWPPLTDTDAAPAPSLAAPEAIHADVDAAAPAPLQLNGDADASLKAVPDTNSDVAQEAIEEEAPPVTASHHQGMELSDNNAGIDTHHGVGSLLDVVALITPNSEVTGTAESSPATEPDSHHGLAHPIDEAAEAVLGDSSEGTAITDEAPSS